MLEYIGIFVLVCGAIFGVVFGTYKILDSPSKNTQNCSKDSDCAEGQSCNTNSNICVKKCTSDNDCNVQSFCHPSEKTCQMRTPCVRDNDCGSQQICDTKDNRCKIDNSPSTSHIEESKNSAPPSESLDDQKEKIPGWHDQEGDFVDSPQQSWGTWRDWGYCPEDKYVCGFTAYNQEPIDEYDDTALNSVGLHCCKRGEKKIPPMTKVFDLEHGLGGEASDPIMCPDNGNGYGFVNSLQGYHEPHHSGSFDDTGMVYFKFWCNDTNEKGEITTDSKSETQLDTYIFGSKKMKEKFKEWGKQHGERFNCPKNMALCGIKLKVEDKRASDATGVSWIQAKCCGTGKDLNKK